MAKTEKIKTTYCEDCKHWRKIHSESRDFGICIRIKRGKDALFCGMYLQTASNFGCYFNAPKNVVSITVKQDENVTELADIAADN